MAFDNRPNTTQPDPPGVNLMMRVTSGNFFDSKCLLLCDDKCSKAWGINNRPRTYFSRHLSEDNPDYYDDYAFHPDQELGEAPANPGTYEGGQGKPQINADKHNKWCWRECERSQVLDIEGLWLPQDFSKPMYNQPWKHTKSDGSEANV